MFPFPDHVMRLAARCSLQSCRRPACTARVLSPAFVASIDLSGGPACAGFIVGSCVRLTQRLIGSSIVLFRTRSMTFVCTPAFGGFLALFCAFGGAEI